MDDLLRVAGQLVAQRVPQGGGMNVAARDIAVTASASVCDACCASRYCEKVSDMVKAMSSDMAPPVTTYTLVGVCSPRPPSGLCRATKT